MIMGRRSCLTPHGVRFCATSTSTRPRRPVLVEQLGRLDEQLGLFTGDVHSVVDLVAGSNSGRGGSESSRPEESWSAQAISLMQFKCNSHAPPLVVSVDDTHRIRRMHPAISQATSEQDDGKKSPKRRTFKHFVNDKSVFHPGLIGDLQGIQHHCTQQHELATSEGSPLQKGGKVEAQGVENTTQGQQPRSLPKVPAYHTQLVLHNGVPTDQDPRLSRKYQQHSMVIRALRLSTQLFERWEAGLVSERPPPSRSGDEHRFATEIILPGTFLTKMYSGPSDEAVLERCSMCFETVQIVDGDGLPASLKSTSSDAPGKSRNRGGGQQRFVVCKGMKARLSHRRVQDPVKSGYKPNTKLWRRTWSVAAPHAAFCLPPLEGDQHLFFCAGCTKPMPVPCDSCVRFFCERQQGLEVKPAAPSGGPLKVHV